MDQAESQERLPEEESVSCWECKRRVRIVQIGDEGDAMDIFQDEEFSLHEVKDVIGFWAARSLKPR